MLYTERDAAERARSLCGFVTHRSAAGINRIRRQPKWGVDISPRLPMRTERAAPGKGRLGTEYMGKCCTAKEVGREEECPQKIGVEVNDVMPLVRICFQQFVALVRISGPKRADGRATVSDKRSLIE
jgi:hypothetical protein